MTSTEVRLFVRRHVLGLVAIFVAIAGTAVAQKPPSSGDEAVARAVTSKKFKKLKKRVKALERLVATPAEGDLEGTFPNLRVRANAVDSQKIADNAVSTPKIADDAVTTPKLAADAVTTPKIANDAVVTDKIAGDAVTAPKLAPNSVGSQEIAQNVVGANELKNLTYRLADTVSVAPGDVELVNSGDACQAAEEEITWGGFWSNLLDPNLGIQGSLFFGDWLVYGGNASGTARNFTGVAGCLPQ